MTVLDLRDSPWVDGPGRTILDCASSLQGTRFKLVIGTFDNPRAVSRAYRDEALRRSLTVAPIRESGALDIAVFRRIVRLIDGLNVNIVHTHDFRSNVIGLACARWRRRPAVATAHGWISNTFRRKLFTRLDKLLLRFFDRVIVVSVRTGALLEKAGIPRERITVIYNALTVDKYIPDRRDTRFRRELGAGNDEILIANIGRLSPEKGQLPFLEAARVLYKQHKNLRFVLIGTGPDRGALEQRVTEYGLGDVVVFTGYRTDMLTIYNSLDLVVQSSYTEGMPNVVLEALLMGVPVIATDVGGTAEIITHDKTGVLLAPGDVPALAGAIGEFLDHPARHRDMARAGGNVIIQNFNHERRVAQLTEVYDAVFSGRA